MMNLYYATRETREFVSGEITHFMNDELVLRDKEAHCESVSGEFTYFTVVVNNKR